MREKSICAHKREIRRVTSAYFSPTGNTRRTAMAAAENISCELGAELCELDLTLPESRRDTRFFGSDELLVMGMPVYAGRLPNKLLDFLNTGFIGERAFAAAILTYGNRSCGSALTELCGLLSSAGFTLCGAAALPARHSFTDALAFGRPNESDMQLLRSFSASAAQNAADGRALKAGFMSDPVAPYYTPLGEDGCPAQFLKAKPVTDREKCTRCGLCARVCPMGSIAPAQPEIVSGVCIKCQACIRKCPSQAKRFLDPAFLSHTAMLEKSFSQPRDPKFYV